jgi:hypothetical protein
MRPRTEEISRGTEETRLGTHRNAHTCPTRSVLRLLELIEVQGGFADGGSHGRCPTGKTEAIQNLPRRFGRPSLREGLPA